MKNDLTEFSAEDIEMINASVESTTPIYVTPEEAKTIEDNKASRVKLKQEELRAGIKSYESKKNTFKLEKSSNKEDKPVETSYLETEDYILEQIKSTTHTTLTTLTTYNEYIVYNKKTGSTTQQKSFEYGGKLYIPIVDKLLEKGAVILPSGVEEYNDNESLIQEIRDFFFKYFEVKGFLGEFLPFLILFYWVYEKFPFVPYVSFTGLTGTGKTTAMEVFGSICYKPIDASGSITMSPIFRVASTWRGTLMLDEFDASGDSYREMILFLKSGVSNKAVLRTEGDAKKEVNAFLVKAPKIFTSEKPMSDAGLQSRTIVVKMEKNKRKIPLYRLNNYLEGAEHIRNKLLLWRLRNLNKINLEDIEYGVDALIKFDRRVQQVITPIYYLSDEKTKKSIEEFAKEQQEETFRERRDAIDGQIFEVIIRNYKAGVLTSLKSISEEMNKNTKYPVTEKKIGSTVRKILGFDIQRLGDENISTVITIDQTERIDELSKYYGIPVGSVVSVGSVVDDPNDPFQEIQEIFK